MHFHWKKILQMSKNARTMSTWNSSIRIWRFHRHGPGSIPGMGIPNAIADVLENFCTILIPCGLVVSIWHSLAHRHGPSSIPGIGILGAIFFNARTAESLQKQFDLRPRFQSLINSCLPLIIFRTINSDNDALSLEKDFTNVEERSNNVNMKFID